MNIYDEAHKLAALLKDSDEYKKYKAARDAAYENETTKSLVKQYKKMQFEAQTTYMAGKQPDNELMDKLNKLGSLLQMNPVVTEFLMAEYVLNKLVSDIYKILGDACDVGTDLFE